MTTKSLKTGSSLAVGNSSAAIPAAPTIGTATASTVAPSVSWPSKSL